MLLLNYSHPLTTEQLARVDDLLADQTSRVSETREVLIRDILAQSDAEAPFSPQATALADAAGLTPREWQSEQILINSPSYNFLAVALIAELHGRMGYFPSVLRLKPVTEAIPPRCEIAEILNLQAIRDAARRRRGSADLAPAR